MSKNTLFDRKNVEDIIPLSSTQKGMLFHYIKDRNTQEYQEQISIRLTGNVSPIMIQKAWDFVVDHNQMLRTIFKWDNIEQPVQIHLKKSNVEVVFKDISSYPEDEIIQRLESLKLENRQTPIEIDRETVRVNLCKINEQLYEFIIDYHHIIFDGWSNGIILQEFLDIYDSYSKGIPPEIPNKTKFKEFVRYLNNQNLNKQKEFWCNYLCDYETTTDIMGQQLFTGDVKTKEFCLSPELTDKIQGIAKTLGISVATIFYSTWGLLLHRLNNTDDVVLGITLSGRDVNISGIEKVVGMFINTIPLRIKLEDNMSVLQLLSKVNYDLLSMKDYENAALSDIHKWVSNRTLFNSIVVIENYPINLDIDETRSLNILEYKINEKTNYNVSLNIELFKDIKIKLSYKSDLESSNLIKKIVDYITNILEIITLDQEIAIREIDFITEDERNELLNRFNNTEGAYPKTKTIHQIFEEQVEKSLFDDAVIFGDAKISYKELNEKANCIANLLIQKGVKPNSVVAIYTERSFEMIIGILAILKSGAAYLPVSTDYPSDRCSYMMSDSGAKLILTMKDSVEFSFEGEIINLSNKEIYFTNKSNPSRRGSSKDLAYVIYTSGSTGKPKGVMIEHHSVVNRLNWMQKQYPLSKSDVILQKTPFTFDVSVWELFWWMFQGGSVCLLQHDGEKDPGAIIDAIEKYNITIMHFVPTMLNVFLENLDKENDIPRLKSLRQVFASGEALSHLLVNKFNRLLYSSYNIRLTNLYGPTEATVDVSYYECSSNEELHNIPIGKPIDNTQLYVLDKYNRLQPIGAYGELYIAGVGLARGYLNKPELTLERFIHNPFLKDSIMYRTGDLARWDSKGDIEYLGRIDYQVKIRGFRIELGEIEKELLNCQDVTEAVVVVTVDDMGNKSLCAYIVATQEVKSRSLREQLLKVIPEYMIPSFFIQLPQLPRTSNGKVDRKTLLKRQNDIKGETEFVEPRNLIEKQLVEIWKQVLNVEKIGIYDNFFELGGDSIKAMQVIPKLRKNGYYLEMKDLYHNPILYKMCEVVKFSNAVGQDKTEEGIINLSPIQKWFFENDFVDKNHWNQYITLYNQEGCNEEVVKEVFSQIINYHDALRIIFTQNKNSIEPYNRGSIDDGYSFNKIDLRDNLNYKKVMEGICEEEHSKVDLEKGPLVRLLLFNTDVGDYLVIIIHHLVIDGVSWRILIEDFSDFYSSALEGRKINLPSKSSSFGEWTKEILEYVHSPILRNEMNYWQHIVTAEVKPLPKDNLVEYRSVGDLEKVEISLTKSLTKNLLQNVNKAYNTKIDDILLTALGLALVDWTGNRSFLVNMEGHGRGELFNHLDISRTIGWFTCQYPIMLNIMEEDLSHIIKTVKENLRKIPNKGIGYGILRYMVNQEHIKDLLHRDPEISFNYLGQFDKESKNGFQILRNLSGASFGKKNKSLYTLDINGAIVDETLNMSFQYNKNEYNKTSTQQIVDAFSKYLEDIILHCMSKQDVELTPSDFGSNYITIDELELVKRKYSSLENHEIEKIYPLSPMQEGMLFHSLYSQETSVYFESIVLTLEGNLDVELFNKSLNTLISRYDILRTVFAFENIHKPHQIVFKSRKTQIQYHDICEYREEYTKQFVCEIIEEDRKRGFDFTKDMLLRVTVLKVRENRYQVILGYHHILLDGWSTGIIFGELFRIYSEFWKEGISESNRIYPYSNYINWVEKQDKKSAEDYWKQYLMDYENKAVIPRTNKTHTNYLVEEKFYKVDKDLVSQIEKMAKRNNVTLNTFFQAIWGVLLQKYNNIDDVVFGSVVSGRKPEIDGVGEMVGLFINTVPIRVRTTPSTIFKELLLDITKDSMLSYKFDYYPLVEIQQHSSLKSNLIDNIMVFENYPVDKEINNIITEETCGYILKDTMVIEQTNYDFNIFIIPEDEFKLRALFNANCYNGDLVENIFNHIITIAKTVVADEGIPLNEINLLTDTEEKKILLNFNDTAEEYPLNQTVYQMFEEQVGKFPHNIAVKFKDTELTYIELNDKIKNLASFLKHKQSIGTNSTVGVLMERCQYLPVAILAIIKSGGVYVPLDPDFPLERLKNIVDDGEIGTIISTEKQIKLLNKLQWQCESLHSYIAIDCEDINRVEEVEENGLMDERLWEYVGTNYTNEVGSGGWISSYTGEEFSKKEMEEYSENILSKLKPYLNKQIRILEIGCASGITMFKLAPFVKEYYGTDLSKTIIEKNQRKVEEEGITNITLACLKADEIDQLRGDNFDIVIINSVIQYFPGYNYLKHVISKSLNVVNDKGILFLGDVMDLSLKSELIQSLEEFKAQHPKYNTKTDFTSELFVSREYFEDLQVETPSFKNIHFSTKQNYTIENELVKFRYDVILEVDKLTNQQTNKLKKKHQYGVDELRKPLFDFIYEKPSEDTLAYIIYTSGSTGRPKGVMISHRALTNFIYAMKDEVDFNHQRTIAAITTISFDISILEIVLPITTGMRTIIVEEESQRDGNLLASHILGEKIDILQMTPSRLQLLLGSRKGLEALKDVRDLIIGGESFPSTLLEKLGDLNHIRIFNVYGPTETTIWSTIKELIYGNSINIGKPIANTSIYILNNNKLAPIGVPGELCIGGEGVALGYLNSKELTEGKFIENPYDKNELIYRTGDCARWLPDGSIDFIGRMDNQVKVRGFRIELEDIESKLLQHGSIEDCAVITKLDPNRNEQYLWGYIKTRNKLSSEDIRKYLSKELPDYMIPLYFTELETMPLNTSGKIDRKALMKLEEELDSSVEYAPPRNMIEEMLVSIWKDALNIKSKLGIDDNFFVLGGHSLKATYVASKIYEKLNFEVTLAQIFRCPTIRQLSQAISGFNKITYSPIKSVEKLSYYPLSSIQKGIFVVSMLEGANTSYNIPIALKLEGELEKNKIQKVFKGLVKRHEAFRTSFHLGEDGEFLQQVHENVDFTVEYFEIEDQNDTLTINNFIKPFDLGKAPLLRVGLFKVATTEYVLVVDMHHIISDGVSLGILVKDFTTLYEEKMLPEIKVTYKDYVNWQHMLANTPKFIQQENYWLDKFAKGIPVLDLPLDNIRPKVMSFKGEHFDVILDESLTENLKKLALENNATLYMTMLASYYILLYKYTGQDNIVVGSSISGRNHPDVENTVGVFINMLPMFNRVEDDWSFTEFLAKVRKITMEAYENQDYPYEKLVEKLQIKRDSSRNPLFDTIFDLQNMDIEEMKIKDLNVEPYKLNYNTTKVDITLAIYEISEGICINIEYNSTLFEQETIGEFGRNYRKLMEEIVSNSNVKIRELEVHLDKKIKVSNSALDEIRDEDIDNLFDF